MAIIAQKSLFGWETYEKFDGLKRLELILAVLDDEKLMATLERERGRGRNEYPVRAVWNSIIVASLRELDVAVVPPRLVAVRFFTDRAVGLVG